MLTEHPLNKSAMVSYARKWAFGRNPAYGNFNSMGGDCTNFMSQCVFAGGAVMNFTQDTGWYYISLNDRAAAWTSVEYFYRFMIHNRSIGPYGKEIPVSSADVGDIIQLGNNNVFYHALIVAEIRNGEPYLCAHTRDVCTAPLSSYTYTKSRCIKLLGFLTL